MHSETIKSIDDLARSFLVSEPNEPDLVERFKNLINPKLGLIKNLIEEDHGYLDEPIVPCFRADLAPTDHISYAGYNKVSVHGGRDLSPKIAQKKAIFEAFERYCLSIYRKPDLEPVSFDALSRKELLVLDPRELGTPCPDNEEKLEDFDLIKTPLHWIKGWSFAHQSNIFIPTQLVYVPYKFENEPCLRDPVSTGAAAGLSLGPAILRGTMEVIERDAAMLMHYRSIPPAKIDPKDLKSDTVISLLKKIADYDFDINLFNACTDQKSIIAICQIIDRTGNRPQNTVTSNCDFDLDKAVEGAVLEAICFRSHMRRALDTGLLIEGLDQASAFELNSAQVRAQYLGRFGEASQYNYLNKSAPVQEKNNSIAKPINTSFLRSWLVNILKIGGDLIIVDVTSRELRPLGVKVVKVIIPRLQSMHLSEKHKFWSDRLLNNTLNGRKTSHIVDLNQTLHPFV